MSNSNIEVLVELYRIVEKKANAVYRTEFVERVWIVPDQEPPIDHQYVSLSTEWIASNPDAKIMRVITK